MADPYMVSDGANKGKYSIKFTLRSYLTISALINASKHRSTHTTPSTHTTLSIHTAP